MCKESKQLTFTQPQHASGGKGDTLKRQITRLCQYFKCRNGRYEQHEVTKGIKANGEKIANKANELEKQKLF
jgi:hypothetical protein